MPVTKIVVTYGRTFSLKPYEMLKPEAQVEVTLGPNDDMTEAWDEAWNEARHQVKQQLIRITDQDREIAQAVWNGFSPEMRREIAIVAAQRERDLKAAGQAPAEPTPISRRG